VVTTLADQREQASAHAAALGARIDAAADAITAQASALRAALDGPARDAEYERLLQATPRAHARRRGLSILTIVWNHQQHLGESLESAREVLGGLAPRDRGEILVLDDASTDGTADVVASFDRGVALRCIRADVSLGLSRARNLLVHACETSHCLVLDADNVAVASGVRELHAAACDSGAVFTYGTVLIFDQDGVDQVVSNEPVGPPLLVGNYVDSLAVIDVAAVEAAGSYTLDPILHAFDDYDLVQRLAARGDLLAFVPTVAGRYRRSPWSHSAEHAYRDLARRRIARSWGGITAPVRNARLVVTHPAVGEIWASPREREHRAPGDFLAASAITRRVLVVGSGGVSNLGDEAMTYATIERVARLRPGVEIDVVADAAALGSDTAVPFRFVGTLGEVCRGISDEEILVGADAAPFAQDLIASRGERLVAPTIDPRSYDVVVFAGGGNLNHIFFAQHTRWRAVLAACLRCHGVPFILSGQGIGPVMSRRERNVIAFLVSSAVRVGLREPASLDVVGGLAIIGAIVDVVGDDALGLSRTAPVEVDALLSSHGLHGSYLVAHARRADYVGADDAALEAWARAVDELALARQLPVLAVAINSQPAAREVDTLSLLAKGRRASWSVVECEAPGTAAGIVGRSSGAVVHSYHEAVFALEQGVPAVLSAMTPYYDLKASGLARLFGLPDAFVVRPGAPLDLDARLRAVADALRPTRIAEVSSGVDAWLDHALTQALEPA
jgi:polysaccharide pyruvyl transferase WcaK-like protein/glycosyltransferase involved in cell wall biosynthesis